MTGMRKAAILLVQMGKENSAKVLSQLRENEVEDLTAEIVRLGAVERDTANRAIDEFDDPATAPSNVTKAGMAFAR